MAWSGRHAGIAAAIAFAAVAALFAGPWLRPPPGTGLDDALCIFSPPYPHDPTSTLGMLEARPVPDDARCPVCGMYPARHPRWAAQVIYGDGAAHFFDSPLSLFIFLDDVDRHAPGRRREDVAAAYVTDITSGRWTDAASAWYVHGSDVAGPMREGNLPPFTTLEAAQDFAAERGGNVLRADAIDREIIDALAPVRRHRH